MVANYPDRHVNVHNIVAALLGVVWVAMVMIDNHGVAFGMITWVAIPLLALSEWWRASLTSHPEAAADASSVQ